MNPSNVKYSSSPQEGTAAESELMVFRSELPTYNPSSNKFVRINLPVAPMSFLDWSDSILSLKFTNRSFITGTANETGAAVKTQLSNLIKSVAIYNQDSEQIEYINNYNLIVNVLDDYTMSVGRKTSVDSILAGGSATGDPDAATAINGADAVTEADGASKVLCDGLVSAFTSGQFLSPLGFLRGVACSIVLELEDPNTCLKVETATNCTAAYAVSDIQIRAKQIKFNDSFNQSFMSSMAAAGATGIHYVSESFMHTQGSLNNGVSSTQNVNFSLNPRSAKYLLVTHRPEADVTNKAKYSLGVRSSAAIQSYQFELNGKAMPNQPIEISDTNLSQGYAQILDSFGQINNLSHQNLITQTGNSLLYSRTQSTACKYVSALTLEDFNSAQSGVYSGLDLSNVSQMSYRPSIATALTSSYRLDVICSIDISYHISADGKMFTVR